MKYFDLRWPIEKIKNEYHSLSMQSNHSDTGNNASQIDFKELNKEYEACCIIKLYWQEIASAMLPEFEAYVRQKTGGKFGLKDIVSKVPDAVEYAKEFTGNIFDFVEGGIDRWGTIKKKAKKTFNIPKKRTRKTRTVK